MWLSRVQLSRDKYEMSYIDKQNIGLVVFCISGGMLRLIKKLHAYNNTLSSAISELVHTRKITKLTSSRVQAR